jgi:histidinol-phosphate phosphatase family protein
VAVNRAAVLLDKDGTLVQNVPYNVDPDRIRLAPGAVDALGHLHRAGYALIVVSNQAGVAHGLFPEPALAAVRQRLRELLAAAGVPLTGFLYCPHHPEASVRRYRRACGCRKPAPGLIRQAALEHDLDLRSSWMVGDTLDDVEAGRRAGCRTVLVDNGGETEWVTGEYRWPHFVAPSLHRAASFILAHARERGRVRLVRQLMSEGLPR